VLTRAILGQQISVVAARTLAARLAERLGARLDTPHAGLHALFPSATQLAAASTVELASLGVLPSRARTLVAAMALAGDLRPGSDPVALGVALQAVRGIGPWTAQYVLLRALSWPDAWPTKDLALLQALGGLGLDETDLVALRPYRGYAAIHLWAHLGDAPAKRQRKDKP